MRTFVIGNEDCVLGFLLAGVDGRIAHNEDELTEAMDESLADKTVALLLVASDVAEWARERIDMLKVNNMAPLVVEIPGEKAAKGYPSLRSFVQRAVGISLGGGEWHP